MKTINVVAIIICLCAAFYLGRLTKRPEQIIETIEVVRDTTIFAHPISIEDRFERVNLKLPVVLFVEQHIEADSTIAGEVVAEVLKTDSDSIDITATLQTRIYEDSTYRAQVSGLAIGQHKPTLDWIEVYQRNTIQTIRAPPVRFEHGIFFGPGVSYGTKGLDVGVVVGYGIQIKF